MSNKANTAAISESCEDTSSPKPGARDIGVMGGMFDPVHQGHLSTALLAKEMFALDCVHMVPCGSPVHRDRASASDQNRIAMLKLALQGQQGLVLDERECITEAPSYTYNTLAAIQSENPSSKLFYILGIDSFNTLPTWHRWQKLFDLAHMLVITRPGWELEPGGELATALKKRQVESYKEMAQHNTGKILISELEPLAISSSEIRTLLVNKQSLQGLLPENVLNYINTHNLYESTGVSS